MVKTNPQTPRKCLSVAEKIRFGNPGSHQTEPNNTEPKLWYSVNSVRSTTGYFNIPKMAISSSISEEWTYKVIVFAIWHT